jgi:predicted PurR-regulated permease PerM
MLMGLCAAVLVSGALYFAQSIFAPMAFALFAIALVWPLQRRLADIVPPAIAMLVTMAVAIATLVTMALLIAWAFGGVGTWVVANSAKLQELYAQKIALLDSYGITVADVFTENFDTRWLVRVAQQITGHLQGILSFTVVTLVFLVFGLLEVETVARQLGRMAGETAPALLRAGALTAKKFRTYMMVRTVMSVLTGLCVWGFAYFMGLDLAAEWGVIAFVLNYIPFLGPLVATLFPTIFAILQFGSWQLAIIVFLCLNLIQTISGSFIEPQIAGASVAVSSFMILLAVFFGSFLWGIPGAFIGVPVLIAALTICQQFPGSRWVANLLSGRDSDPA